MACPPVSSGNRSAHHGPGRTAETYSPTGSPHSSVEHAATWPGRYPSCAIRSRTGQPGGTSHSPAAPAATPATTADRCIRPVLVRDWSPAMDGITATIYASRTTQHLGHQQRATETGQVNGIDDIRVPALTEFAI